MPVQMTQAEKDARRLERRVATLVARNLRELSNQWCDVGVQGPRGSAAPMHQPRNPESKRKRISIAQVLAYHEFGWGVPKRSVIAATMADGQTKSHLEKLKAQLALAYILKAHDTVFNKPKTDANGERVKKPRSDATRMYSQGVGVLGKYAVEQMRRRIMSRIAPPLGPWAIKAAGLRMTKRGKLVRKKGLDRSKLRDRRLIPLLDTRQIYKSLRFNVDKARGSA